MLRSCQPAGVPGPARRTRCQSGAPTARWRALSRACAPSPLRGVAGPARHGRVPVSGHIVAGLVAGLCESAPDAGDTAESRGHRPPSLAAGPQGQPESLLLSRQPRASQRNDLWMDLWTIWMNAQINHCTAVDARGCGKVDNRTAQSCQAAAVCRPRGTPVLPRRVTQRVKAPDRRRQGTGRCIAAQDALKVRGAGDNHEVSYHLTAHQMGGRGTPADVLRSRGLTHSRTGAAVP